MTKWKQQIAILWMVVVTLGLIIGTVHQAGAEISTKFVNDGDIKTEIAGIAVIWGNDDIDIYHSVALNDLVNFSKHPEAYNGAIMYRGVGFPPPSLNIKDLIPLCQAKEVSVLTFYFPDSSVVEKLSTDVKSALSERLKKGNAFIGTRGSITKLISDLNLPESDDINHSEDRPDSFVEFTYPKDDGVRENLFLTVSPIDTSVELSIGQIWNEISTWCSGNDLVSVTLPKSSALEAPAAWNRTFNQDFKGTLVSGTAHLRVTGWKLDTTSTESDYYLVRLELQSHINAFKYRQYIFYADLGWYTSEQALTTTLGENCRVWDYIPNTAIKNVTTGVDFSIGGDLGGKVEPEKWGVDATLKANLSFKQSYTAPEIALLDNTDKANNKIGVYIEYPLADWRLGLFYVKNPPDVSQTTFNLIGMFIAEVPTGNPLIMTVTPKVNHRMDYVNPLVNLNLFTGASLTHYDRAWTDNFKVTIGGK